MSAKPKVPEGCVIPPFVGEANASPGAQPGAVLVEVTEEEIRRHETDTTLTAEIVLAVHRTAQLMRDAVIGGHVDQNDLSACLALVTRATDPEPKGCFEDAENFAFSLQRRFREAREGKP